MIGKWGILAVTAMVVISIFPHSNADAAPGAREPIFVAAPVRFSGAVKYGVSTLFPVTAKPPTSAMLQTMEAKLFGRTRAYIWQPWFLQLTAGIGASVARTVADKSTNALDLIGRGDFSLLPRSKYPLHAFIEQQTQSPDDELFGIERLVTRYGTDFSYMSNRGGLFVATYDASLTDNRASLMNLKSRETFADRVTSELFFRRPGNDLRLQGSYRREVQKDIEAKHWGRNFALSHRFRPNRDVDISNLASFAHSVDKTRAAYDSSKFSQMSSSFSWRPLGKPLSVFGAVSGSQSKGGGGSTNSAAASLGLGTWFSHSENWRSRLRASTGKAKGQSGIFTQTFNSSYNNRAPFLGFNYGYNLGGGATNRMREGQTSQNYQASAGHSISRGFPLLKGNGSYGISQTLSEGYATDDRIMSTALRHNAHIGWTLAANQASTQMSLSGGVSHLWGSSGRKRVVQLTNFQITRRQTFSRESSLTANITAQATRTSTLLEGSTGYSGSMRGFLDYRHTRLFEVPNLRMSSIVVIASGDVSPSTGLPREIDLESWETRLDYFFGKLTSSLIMRISGSDGNYFGSIAFTVSRRFG